MPGPCADPRERVAAAVADREVRSLVLGWDASCGCSRLSGGAAVGRWGGSSGSLHSASPTSMGRRAARERPSTGQRHIPKSKPQKPLPNSPCGARGGSASQRQRTKANCTDTQPAPAPDAARCPRPGRASSCAPPIACRPLVSLARTGDLAKGLVPSIFECIFENRGSLGRISVQTAAGSWLVNPYTRFIQELPGVVQTAGMVLDFRDAQILQTRRWKPAQCAWLRVAQLLDLKWLVWYKFLQNKPKAAEFGI